MCSKRIEQLESRGFEWEIRKASTAKSDDKEIKQGNDDEEDNDRYSVLAEDLDRPSSSHDDLEEVPSPTPLAERR